MSADYWSVGQAATRLGVSHSKVKQLAQVGELEGYKTDGGYWRISAASVEAYRTGRRVQAPRAAAPSDVLPSPLEKLKEDVQLTNIQADLIQAKRRLRAVRDEDVAEGAKALPLGGLENERERLRLQEKEQDREDERQRAEQTAKQWHRAWVAAWLKAALDYMASKERPVGFDLELPGVVEKALEGRDPSEPDEVARALVLAAINAALTPWRHQQTQQAEAARREQLVQHAVQGLTFGATDGDRLRATAAGRSALQQVPPGASDMELQVAVTEAVASTHQAINDRKERQRQATEEAQARERRERSVASAPNALPWGATDAEKADAAAAVREAFGSVPLGAPQTEEQSAMAGALAPIRGAIEERNAAQRQQAQCERNKGALITFAVSYALNYLDELDNDGDIELEPGGDFDDVRRDFEAMVRSALEQKLTGDESQDEANRIARQIVDDELE